MADDESARPVSLQLRSLSSRGTGEKRLEADNVDIEAPGSDDRLEQTDWKLRLGLTSVQHGTAAMSPAHKQRIRLSGGAELSFTIAGATSDPPILLLHGFPSSARTFRDVIPALSKTARVIAPDLPGFGESDVLPSPSFASFGEAVSELLEQLSVGPRYIYLHDFGAPVGLDIAMKTPDQVLGVIVQNANAHQTGMGPQWATTKAYWADPSPENEAEATGHLTYEGTRDQYIADVPEDVAARMSTESWEEDWRVMQLPGRMETQRALIADYGNYFARFEAIADYLTRWQPSALMIWGRHDAFFDLAETLSWMQALPRMESHILDGTHFLLETHAAEAAELMVSFIERHKWGGHKSRSMHG